jgi:hypothetical protein
MSNGRANSVVLAGPMLKRSITAKRVASDSAWKTSARDGSVAEYLGICRSIRYTLPCCQPDYRIRMPGCAPDLGSSRNTPGVAVSSAWLAASTMPSLTPNFILRGARLAIITVSLPIRSAGS